MAKGKPFSGSKKKEQLKARRAKRRGEVVEKPEKSSQPHQKGKNQGKKKSSSSSSSKSNKGNDRGGGVIKEIYGLRTVFAREEDEVVAERKLRGQKPIKLLRSADDDRSEWEREPLRPKYILGMPRRPPWSEDMSKAEVERNEEHVFKKWLQSVYERGRELEGEGQGELNFFEHNLEVWRQLWRALEMGDCMLVCADVRWPAFTFPYALVEYARDLGKPVVLCLTKTDLVAAEVALEWEKYFVDTFPGLHVVCTHSFPVLEDVADDQRVTKKASQRPKALKNDPETKAAILETCKRAIEWEDSDEVHPDRPYFTLSAVGAPNAGKSAIINLLIEAHKVSVSATPGHTKHFQTHFVSPECRLLDSPGLMFPSVSRDARVLQTLVGNYPVSQLREPFSAVSFLAARVNLPKLYGLAYPYDEDDSEEEDSSHAWTAYELCAALAQKRGFMLKGGNHDLYRSGKSILAESLRGILRPVYWLPPVDEVANEKTPEKEKEEQEDEE